MVTAEQKHRKDLERLRSFRPMDDDFMRCLFKDNIPLAEMVLRIITGKPDLVLTSCQTQKDMKRLAGARSICLDAYGTDSTGKKYDMEIQREDKGADPHRARFHSSVMDIENLDSGQEFCELPDTFTIFITEKDFYGKGEPIYFIDMNFRLLADRTRYLKENPKGVSEIMCRVIEDMRKEEREEGIREGMRTAALRMIADGTLAPEKIAEYAGLSLDEVKKLQSEQSA